MTVYLSEATGAAYDDTPSGAPFKQSINDWWTQDDALPLRVQSKDCGERFVVTVYSGRFPGQVEREMTREQMRALVNWAEMALGYR